MVHCAPLGTWCTMRVMGNTGTIERADRLSGGDIGAFIADAARYGASHRTIAVELAARFGLDVSHTTVGRYLKAQAAK